MQAKRRRDIYKEYTYSVVEMLKVMRVICNLSFMIDRT
jgi:hypothetical protein